MKTSALHNHNGFTLIEAMISLAIVSIGLLGITQMQVTSMNGNTTAVHSMRAVLESDSFVEQVLSTTYSSLSLAAGASPVPSLFPSASNGKYTTSFTVSQPVVSQFGDTIKQINTNVTWTDINGRTKTITTTFFMTPDYN